MNTELESSLIKGELDTLIDDYNNTANSSTEDDFAELNKTYLENLKNLEIEITNKYSKENESEYEEKYYPILYQIKKEKEKIQQIIFKNMNDELERLDKDYNKSLNNDIKQNIKNIGFNLLCIVFCIILIILFDNSISDWIFGILLFGNCLMLFINSVKYFNNKFYKSQLDKHKKATGKGELYGKIYKNIDDNNGIKNAAPLIKEFIKEHNMINPNPVFDKFRENVIQRFDYENENANNIKTN